MSDWTSRTLSTSREVSLSLSVCACVCVCVCVCVCSEQVIKNIMSGK